MTDLHLQDATELARLVRTRTVSPVEVVDAFLERIDRVNPELNAFCVVPAEQARAAARLAEAAVLAGAELGPLHGVPVAFKDLTPTQGIETTAGSWIFEKNIPETDAIGVQAVPHAARDLVSDSPDGAELTAAREGGRWRSDWPGRESRVLGRGRG